MVRVPPLQAAMVQMLRMPWLVALLLGLTTTWSHLVTPTTSWLQTASTLQHPWLDVALHHRQWRPPWTSKDYHFRLKKQSFTEELLKGLCWRQLERELKDKFPARQAAAQYREYRKGHARDSPRTLLYNVSEFLSQERRNDLEHMSAALRCMLEDDMQDNDLHWLEHLPEGPMPERLVAMQYFQRAVFASLLEQAGAADAAMVSHLSVELASNTFYRPAMRLLWPILSAKQRLEVQQWFFRYSMQMDEKVQSAASASSSSTGR